MPLSEELGSVAFIHSPAIAFLRLRSVSQLPPAIFRSEGRTAGKIVCCAQTQDGELEDPGNS